MQKPPTGSPVEGWKYDCSIHMLAQVSALCKLRHFRNIRRVGIVAAVADSDRGSSRQLGPARHAFVRRPDTHEVAVHAPDEVLGRLDRVEDAVVIEEDSAEREGSHKVDSPRWLRHCTPVRISGFLF
jgi:hypothetical protein